MKNQIYGYLKELVKIPSVSNTEGERDAAKWLSDAISSQDYFKVHPEYAGLYELPGDRLGRGTPYGLVKGSSDKTIILTGHYDVVDTSEYGKFENLAYDIEGWKKLHGQELEELLAMLPPRAREDFESGQWIFGRGVNDMKGGLCIGLALLDWYGKWMLREPGLPGNLLFAAVADEEAYSAGMRGSAGFFVDLKEKQKLDYSCLVDLEPVFDGGQGMEVNIGSVGKTMPAVLVQGAKAHVVECFRGLNAVGVLADFFLKTELAPEFSERYEDEICPPPTWFNLRDRKKGYDVSVPLRAAGYMSMLGYARTPEEILSRLKELGKESFRDYMARMKKQEEAAGICTPLPAVDFDSCVMEYGGLLKFCKEKGGSDFEVWYKKLYEKTGEQVENGDLNYPQATLEVMEALLDYSGITRPLMVIAFAPPYYPAFHSDRIEGKEGAGSAAYEILAQAAEDTCGARLLKKHYFCGISDLSYCGGPREELLRAYAANAPLWGNLYRMDFGAMSGFKVPSLLFGPIGRDAHQMSERVNAASLLEEIPEIMKNFIEQMFAKP